MTFCAATYSDCHCKGSLSLGIHDKRAVRLWIHLDDPSFEVDIMSLWEMHSELQDDTSALERRLWLQMHLSAATLPSYSSSSSSSSSSLRGEGEQRGDKQEGKRRGEGEGERGSKGNVMQKCAVQTEEAVWMPITNKFPSLNRHTHTALFQRCANQFPRHCFLTVSWKPTLRQFTYKCCTDAI